MASSGSSPRAGPWRAAGAEPTESSTAARAPTARQPHRRPQLTAFLASVRIRLRSANFDSGGRWMKHTLACSATLVAPLLLLLSGCGGGGGGTGGGTPATPKTAAPPAPVAAAPAAAPAAGTPPTTLAEGEEEGADNGPPPLLAWAEAEPEDGDAPLTVQFKADIEGGDTPLKYKWTFGDGTPDSTDASPKHTYDKPGKYRADLYVENNDGEDSDSDYVEIDVKEATKK